MKLLIDAGNTRLKWATLSNGVMSAVQAFSAADIATGALAWTDLSPPDTIYVASVVAPEQETAISTALQQCFALQPVFIRSPPRMLGVTNAYEHAECLGIDRFLALLAMHRKAPTSYVIASIGTALTLDALNANGRHLGGLITTSPELSRRALVRATARIDESGGQIVEQANNTADAVYSGSILAAVALIERFCIQLNTRVENPPALIITGGGAKPLLAFFPQALWEPDLVLQGLREWVNAA